MQTLANFSLTLSALLPNAILTTREGRILSAERALPTFIGATHLRIFFQPDFGGQSRR